MGNSRELNKARSFEGIIADMDANAEAEKPEGELVERGPNVTFPPLLREVYAPLVWIPELGGDTEMTDNTDDEELDNELMEEEELDELDMDAEMKHESELWDKTQKFRDSGPVRGGERRFSFVRCKHDVEESTRGNGSQIRERFATNAGRPAQISLLSM